MKKTNQYLPFILWSILTIVLTGLIFVILPIILLWGKFVTRIGRDTVKSVDSELCYS
jgi:hypothetical protein